MTATITDPDKVTEFLAQTTGTPTHIVEAIRAGETPQMPACPEFCDGTCPEWDTGDGDGHHSSGFSSLTVEVTSGHLSEPAMWMVSASRSDDDFEAGDPVVNLLSDRITGDSSEMTPVEARQLAALLMSAADMADPLPLGVLPLQVQQVRFGDEILTEDGWQTAVGQMVFSDQVNIWTDGHDRDPDTDGWLFKPGDVVKVRRQVHGSCAIAFEEPAQ